MFWRERPDTRETNTLTPEINLCFLTSDFYLTPLIQICSAVVRLSFSPLNLTTRLCPELQKPTDHFLSPQIFEKHLKSLINSGYIQLRNIAKRFPVLSFQQLMFLSPHISL